MVNAGTKAKRDRDSSVGTNPAACREAAAAKAHTLNAAQTITGVYLAGDASLVLKTSGGLEPRSSILPCSRQN